MSKTIENSSMTVMSVKDWVVTILVSSIPVIGLIMLFAWAFGGNVNKNKENYSKGMLIMMAIIFGIYIMFMLLFGLALFSSMVGAGS